MQPVAPRPYGHTRYPMPAAPLHYAQRVPMTDGAQLAMFVYGPATATLRELLDGEPILALHGNGGSHSTFVQVIDTLVSAGKGVIAIDARAQGQSTRGTAALTYERMAEDAIAVLDHLGVAGVHIVGHSDGGILALLLARDHADRVCSIVAGGANLTPEGVIDEWDTPGSVAAQRAWADYWDDGDRPDEARPTQVDHELLSPSVDEARRAAELLQLMLDEPQIDAASLGTIRCPTCVLVGEHDCIDRAQTEAIAAAIPGARLVTVAGMGHGLPHQAPDSVCCQVLINILLSQ